MRYTREQRAAHKAMRDVHHRHAENRSIKHPLDGLSIREWVAEAREGWPRVPVPADPYKAAQRVRDKWEGDAVEGYGGLVEFEWAE